MSAVQKKKNRRILQLVALALCFAMFDVAVYNLFTKRYIDRRSDEMKSKSVEVSSNLPFDADSHIYKLDVPQKLSGDLPVLDGAAALFPMYSAFVNAVYPKDSVSFDGKDFTKDSALQFTNTRGAYKAVVDGTADIVFCAKPSKEQLEYAEQKGVKLEMVPIGYEAFVFIVNKQNPVNDLTTEQVKGIYSGKYTKWSQVGGDDSYIDAVQRNKGSGSQSAMLSFMGDTPMHRSLLGALFGRSIAYSFRYYVSNMSVNSDVKILSLNGVYPDEKTIASKEYPISSNFYAVYDSSNKNGNVKVLIDFILSEKGQQIVKQSGYVPLNQ